MTTDERSRLVIGSRPALRDRLHGAWWPASDDIVRELAPMLSAAADLVPPIVGVSLNRGEWPDAPLRFRALTTRSPAISWYGLHEPHLAILVCAAHRKYVLLLIPPDSPDDMATAAMLMASAPGNSLGPLETLTKARAGTRPPLV